jgi:hypothetical protein
MMDKGLWIWPTDPKGQKRMLRKIVGSQHVMMALQGIAKSDGGMSNSEIDELLGDNSEWITLWAVRQLTALGFIEYKVDLFGGPAKYVVTDLGRNSLVTMSGKQSVQKPSPTTQQGPTAQTPTPKTA